MPSYESFYGPQRCLHSYPALCNSDSLLSRRHLSKIYFPEASIDFFINNRPLDRSPTGKSLDLLLPPLATFSDRLIARRSAHRYNVKHLRDNVAGLCTARTSKGSSPHRVGGFQPFTRALADCSFLNRDVREMLSMLSEMSF